MTGRLPVHYRRPTPLDRELRFEAGIDRVEGRKIITRGELVAGERLCAEAEGIFVSARPGSMQELMEQREAWETEHTHEP